MIRKIAVNDTVGFRTFSGAIQYGQVMAVELRGSEGRASRRDEIYILLRHSGNTVLVQRWRIVERYSAKLSQKASKAANNNSI